MKRIDLGDFLAGLIIFVLVVGAIALTIYVHVVYGDKTIDELPAWVLPFFLGGN